MRSLLEWLSRLVMALGIASLCGAIWLGLPILGDGWWADPRVRAGLIGFVLVVVCLALLSAALRRRRATRRLEEQLLEQSGGDEEILAQRMQTAVAHLKRSAGATSLYDLPWYVIIGPPGAGKTTALVHSGIEFPGTDAASIRGFGGTRNCDFWFARDAVMIDTAGRYTTQDSDRVADKVSWQALLRELKSVRPDQPVNGVLVAFSCADLITEPAEALAAHAATIRERLAEIYQALRLPVPVYVVLTKADMIAGFRETFDPLSEAERRQVWGHTFRTRKRLADTSRAVPGAFDELVARVCHQVTDRLAEEPDGQSRIAIQGFPEQLALLQLRAVSFLRAVFDAPGETQAWLRGFYFTSGTQAGTPVDQVLGAMGAGADQPAFLSGRGRSYFLHDLLTRVIFAERDWIGYDRARLLRRTLVRGVGKTLIGAACAGAMGLLAFSYWTNASLVRSSGALSAQYLGLAAPLLSQQVIDQTDTLPLLPSLDVAWTLAKPEAEADPSAWTDVGLSRRAAILGAADQAYSGSLERLLRPRMMLLLERQLADHVAAGNQAAAFRALKIYILLARAQPGPDEDSAVQAYFAETWAPEYLEGGTDDAYRRINHHLAQMLDRDDRVTPGIAANAVLISRVREAVAAMPPEQQVFELIRDRAAGLRYVSFGPLASDGVLAGEGHQLEALGVPGLFSADGFWQVFWPETLRAEELLTDYSWILDQPARPLDRAEFTDAVMTLYQRELTARWNRALDRVGMGSDRAEAIRALVRFVALNTGLMRALSPETSGDNLAPALQILSDQNMSRGQSLRVLERYTQTAQGGLSQWHALAGGQVEQLISDLRLAGTDLDAWLRLRQSIATLPDQLARLARDVLQTTPRPSGNKSGR